MKISTDVISLPWRWMLKEKWPYVDVMRDKQRSPHYLTLICMNLPVGIWVFIRGLFTSEPRTGKSSLSTLHQGECLQKPFPRRLGKTIVSLAKFLTSGLLITNSCQTTNLHHYFNLELDFFWCCSLAFSLSLSWPSIFLLCLNSAKLIIKNELNVICCPCWLWDFVILDHYCNYYSMT